MWGKIQCIIRIVESAPQPQLVKKSNLKSVLIVKILLCIDRGTTLLFDRNQAVFFHISRLHSFTTSEVCV